MRSTVFAFVIAFGAVTAPSLAHAQQPGATTQYPTCSKAPSKAEVDAAHGAYLAGRHSFDEGDYATAIMYFKDAYRRDCTKHELLPIVARAYELSQNRADAIVALETFLKRVPPNDPQIDAIKKRIQNLRASETKSTLATTLPAAGPAEPASASPPPPPPQSQPPASPEPAENKPSIAPWFLVGAGAVGAIVGTVVLLGGLSKRSDAVDRCPQETASGRVCPPGEDARVVNDQFESGTSQATVGGVVLGFSAVAVVGGLVWYAVDRRAAASARGRFVPVLAQGSAGASYVVRF